MDKIVNLLGEKGAGFFLVKAEREKKKERDRIPKPEKQINLESYCLEMEEATKKELEAKGQSIVVSVNNEISSMWSEPFFKETLRKKVMALPVGERGAILPFIQKYAEATIYQMQLDAWDKRSAAVDRNIRGYESGFPKPFTMSMMNVDKDYPEERIGFVDNKPYDKWISKQLGEKRPVFFEPYERWGEKLAECYEKVYLVTAKKEREEEAKRLAPPVVKVEPPPPPPSEQAGALHGFFSEGVEESGTLRGRVSRIYKGGK